MREEEELVLVALDAPVGDGLIYRVPSDLRGRVRPGCVVKVPLRSREAWGIVIERSAPPTSGSIREITGLLEDEPLLSPGELEWMRWASRYYLKPLGQVLATALSPILWSPKATARGRLRLVDQGEIQEAPPLTQDQSKAMGYLEPAIRKGEFRAFLLWGVTGSGKTEVYLRAASSALECGKEVTVLVPEISLTHQLVREFRSRFGEKVGVLHSRLSRGERREMWLKVHKGELPVIIGARSAIFAPCHKLGLVIVDEEHDSAYKQEEGFRYNARDLALMKGKLLGFPVILGSATPSLESFFNAKRGRYTLLRLPQRLRGGRHPQAIVVDMKRVTSRTKGFSILSPPLEEAMEEALGRREQILLFLNRRGFATLLLCRECGHTLKCRNCEVSLVYHLRDSTYLCHYCGFKQPACPVCPSCGGSSLRDLGIGTETIEMAVRERFPEARVLRMDRDTVSRKRASIEILRAWRKGEADIMIGTQMVAKGHHVPNVTLVGVILAEASLNVPDFRASERTFQLLVQVAGRAGRGGKPGKFIIQTFDPEHPAIVFSATQDYEAFASRELVLRKEAGYPPFLHLALVRISGPKEDVTRQAAMAFGNATRRACSGRSVICLGPSPAPIWRLKGRFRWHMLLKASSRGHLREVLKEALTPGGVRLPSRVMVTVDVDPQSFM